MINRWLTVFVLGIFTFVFVTGCSGILEKQAERAEKAGQGLAEAKFETYSKAAAIGALIEIENTLSTPVMIKFIITEDEDAWKLFEVPAKDTLQIEVGAREYLLEAQGGVGGLHTLYLSPGNASVRITGDWFDN